MTKVGFIVIGAQKCGTTSLAEILMSHPNIAFCKKKEPHYFSKNPDWKKNIESYYQKV